MTDFALIMQDMRPRTLSPFKLDQGRVVDRKARYKVVEERPGVTFTVKVCYHGRALNAPCGLCEYEYPRLGETRER